MIESAPRSPAEFPEAGWYAGKTVLVTGGRGYVGSRLSEVLLQAGAQLRLQTTKSWPEAPKKVTVVVHDFAQPFDWSSALDGVDVVFHLAHYEDAKAFEPHRSLRVNGEATLELLEACRFQELKPKVVFASSANLVGLVDRQPVDESFTDHPLTIYAIHKLLAERYLAYYAHEFSIPAATLRLANVYGPTPNSEVAQRPSVNKMIAAALEQSKFMLFANRKCHRDHLYIDDAVRAFLTAGSSTSFIDGTQALVGSGEDTTFEDIANQIQQAVTSLTKVELEVVIDDDRVLPLVEHREFIANTSKLHSLTGWKPQVFLVDGISRTANWQSGLQHS